MLPKMTGGVSCFFYCFLRFTGYCVNMPSVWLHIPIDIVGGTLALALTGGWPAAKSITAAQP